MMGYLALMIIAIFFFIIVPIAAFCADSQTIKNKKEIDKIKKELGMEVE
jgi:hypothetical protein